MHQLYLFGFRWDGIPNNNTVDFIDPPLNFATGLPSNWKDWRWAIDRLWVTRAGTTAGGKCTITRLKEGANHLIEKLVDVDGDGILGTGVPMPPDGVSIQMNRVLSESWDGRLEFQFHNVSGATMGGRVGLALRLATRAEVMECTTMLPLVVPHE
jgi:hypothetical protein